ncbi:MAG TPA: hypothetical protein VEB42_03080, partial [Chitinophagaceae bacterium]|nr:hypothetical protein [Chitinophagaceae bacterium]
MPASHDRFQSLFQWSLCLVAFAVPMPFRVGSLSVILLTLAWLLAGKYRNSLTTLLERKIL